METNFGHISRPGSQDKARVSQPRILGTNCQPKMPAGPLPSWPKPMQLRSIVVNDRNVSSTDCRGSKGSSFKAARTERVTRGGRRWFNLLAPLRNLMTKSCFPTNLPSTASWCAAIVATYTLRVEGDSPRSNPSCRKESTTLIRHLRWSSWWEEHQSRNRFHFSL